MAGKVGEAFVEIVADYKAFVQKAEKELNVLLKRLAAKADFDPMTEASEDAGEESAEAYHEGFERQSSRDRSRRRRLGERMGRDYSRGIRDGADSEGRRRGGIFSGLLGGDGGRDRNLFGSILGGIGGVVSGVFGALGSIGGVVTGAIGALGSLASGFMAIVVVGGILIPVIYVLTGALISLSGILIPLAAGFAGLLVVVPVLMAAFSGFGEAVSALAEGDLEKFNEALGKLSPNARTVAKELQSIWPALEKIKTVIQDAFFAPLVGDLERFGDRVLPKITPGLERIAGLLGNMASSLLEKISSPAGIKFLETTLSTIGDIIENSGPGIERFFKGLGDAFIAALPFAEELFKAITDGLGDFGDFISENVEDGDFQKFLEDALQTGKEFMGVLNSLLELFKALFEDTDEGGKTFLKDISEALDILTTFFKSKDGKAALQAMIELAKLFGKAMAGLAMNVGTVYRGLKKLKEWAEAAWKWLGKLFDRAKEWSSPHIARGLRFLDGLDIPFFADGGVVTRPTLGMIGEAGAEVVVPLTNPSRARQLMEETGLVDLAGGMGGDGETTVIVYLGTEQITDILDQRITKGFKQQGRRLTQGVREG